MEPKGFVLVEVILTVTLIAVGGVALAGSLAVAARAVNDGRLRTDALIEARNEIEALRSLGVECSASGRRYRTISGGEVSVYVEAAGPVGATRITVTSVVLGPQGSIRVSLTTVVPCTD